MIETVNLPELVKEYDTILIGLGNEWNGGDRTRMLAVYNQLYELVKYKNFFLVTMATDAVIYDSGFGISAGFLPPARQLVAPCGNETWQQCSQACRKDIWEPGEVADGRCPHCGALLTGNTIAAAVYIEEGYQPQWNRYMEWLSKTVGRPLLMLELGVDEQYPTVIRRPFEKTAQFNRRAKLVRINEKDSQVPADILDQSRSVSANSVVFVENQKH